MRVCLSATHLLWNTQLGGHAWVFLNWALGLQAAGARIVLYDKMRWAEDPQRLLAHLRAFRSKMAELDLEVEITLLETESEAESLADCRAELAELVVPLEEVFETAELLLNFKYAVPQHVVDRFQRSALIDIDPGLLQNWIHGGHVRPAVHDMNFTIGETVGQPGAKFSDCGMTWLYSPPPVHLPSWPVTSGDGPFSTVTNWWGEYEVIDGESINNEKRTNFIAYIDLPAHVKPELELAIYHEEGHPSDMPMLARRGWRARPAREVSSSPEEYRRYIQSSRGEFSCAKQSCMAFANAWISDRTICYMASGKPAVVQHTGWSRFLPDAEGLFRFQSLGEAVRALNHLAGETAYREACLAARALVEEHFDAEKVMAALLARALAHAPRGRDRASQ